MKKAFALAFLAALTFSFASRSSLAMTSPMTSPMTKMTDEELSGSYTGVPPVDFYYSMLQALGTDNSQELANSIFSLQQSILQQIFDWDKTVINDVDHSTTQLVTESDGVHIIITLDHYIGEIILANVRPHGSDPNGPYFGTFTITNISIHGTLDIVHHP